MHRKPERPRQAGQQAEQIYVITFVNHMLFFCFLQRAEVILGGIVITASRFQKLNFPYPFVIGQFGLVIPKPSSEVDITAVWKPFQGQV